MLCRWDSFHLDVLQGSRGILAVQDHSSNLLPVSVFLSSLQGASQQNFIGKTTPTRRKEAFHRLPGPAKWWGYFIGKSLGERAGILENCEQNLDTPSKCMKDTSIISEPNALLFHVSKAKGTFLGGLAYFLGGNIQVLKLSSDCLGVTPFPS